MKLIYLLLLTSTLQAQNLKKYKWVLATTFAAGLTDGVRDASMYRMDGAGKFWNGKNSWLNKYQDNDMTKGPAYFGSTSFLVWTTDAPHMFNLFTHQFQTMSILLAPEDKNKKFGHILLKAAIINAARSAGHYITYDLIKYR